MQETKHWRFEALAGFAVVLVMLLVPVFLDAGDRLLGLHTRLWLPPCLFHYITGVPCPLCGLTTSFSLLVHGRVGRAFLANPAGPLIYFVLAIWAATTLVALARDRRPHWSIGLTGVHFIAALAIMWVLRLVAWAATGF